MCYRYRSHFQIKENELDTNYIEQLAARLGLSSQ
jgi:hypothetical protein